MRKTVLLLASATLALLLASGVALAAFPGGNGKIAFVSYRDGNAEIYTMNPDGSDQQRLTEDPASDTEPAWSAFGKKIAFVSDRTGKKQVYVMRSDGTGLRQVTRAAKPSSSPAWSPNGRRLVFERYMGESTHYDLFTVNADGTGGGRLTDYGGAELGPDWSPDGRRIVFGSYRYRYDDSSLCTVSQKGTGRSCFGRTSASVTNNPDFPPTVGGSCTSSPRR